MSITDPTEAYFKDGGWGWDLTRWRKLALLFGYTDRWAENLGTAAAPGGTYTGAGTAVPAGYVYVLQALSIANNTGARGMSRVWIRSATYFCFLGCVATPAQYEPCYFSGAIVLKEGDYAVVQQADAVAGDVIYAAAVGYKMKINE